MGKDPIVAGKIMLILVVVLLLGEVVTLNRGQVFVDFELLKSGQFLLIVERHFRGQHEIDGNLAHEIGGRDAVAGFDGFPFVVGEANRALQSGPLLFFYEELIEVADFRGPLLKSSFSERLLAIADFEIRDFLKGFLQTPHRKEVGVLLARADALERRVIGVKENRRIDILLAKIVD